MPESPLETHELKEQLEEAIEHGHHAHAHGEPGAAWVMYLSLSTAFIAVFAAIASLYAGGYANEAILLKNDAVLKKSQASDTWNDYESRKIKSHIYTAQADALPPERREAADKFRASVERELKDAKPRMDEAKRLDAESVEKNEEAEGLLHKHESMARAVTVFQVAIALSAIAALTKKKVMWFCSLAFGVGGLALFLWGFRPHSAAHADGRESAAEHPAAEGKPAEP